MHVADATPLPGRSTRSCVHLRSTISARETPTRNKLKKKGKARIIFTETYCSNGKWIGPTCSYTSTSSYFSLDARIIQCAMHPVSISKRHTVKHSVSSEKKGTKKNRHQSYRDCLNISEGKNGDDWSAKWNELRSLSKAAASELRSDICRYMHRCSTYSWGWSGDRADLQAPFGFNADSRAITLNVIKQKSGKIKGSQGWNSGFTTGTPVPEVNLPEPSRCSELWYRCRKWRRRDSRPQRRLSCKLSSHFSSSLELGNWSTPRFQSIAHTQPASLARSGIREMIKRVRTKIRGCQHGDLGLPVWKILKRIAKSQWTGLRPVHCAAEVTQLSVISKKHVCVKLCRPPMPNTCLELLSETTICKPFQENLLRSEVIWCDQIHVDIDLHWSTCLASWISTQKEPFLTDLREC